jgi:HEPN/Toprim N-terminal domain 1
MSLFRATDKKIITVKDKSKLPNQLSRWVQYIEDNDETNIVFYSASTKVIKDRLELSGYSLETSKKAYGVYLQKVIKDYNKRFELHLNTLSTMNVEYWLLMLKEIRVRNIKNNPYNREKNENPSISYMCSHDWYGFPCIGYYGSPDVDIRIALRLIIEMCIEDEEFIYDLTDLVLGDCFDLDDDFVDYTSSLVGDKGKIIILTEGKSDTFILSESLKLLYPHLSDYFSFMDFDGAKVGGGADSLATMVKSFSGAGILNSKALPIVKTKKYKS